MITSRLRFEPGEMLVDQWQGDNRRSASSRLLQQVCLLVCVSGIRLRTNLPTFLQEFDIITVVVAFSSLARIWGKCSTIHSPPALYFFSFFFFFDVEISSRALIPLFMAGSVHSGSASWNDCCRMFRDKLRVSSFPDRFPYYAWTAA